MYASVIKENAHLKIDNFSVDFHFKIIYDLLQKEKRDFCG